MQVHYNIDSLPLFKNAVLTIGTFDGVHKGHQQIIDAVLKHAALVDGESVIITFHPHPRKIVQPGNSLQLINTLEEKIALLGSKGIDHLIVVPFSADFANLSAEAYIEDFIVRLFQPHTIIIGYDHHFGKGRTGNFQMLNKEKHKWGYELIEIPKHVLDEIDISSTKIRNAILKNQVEIANKLLGYNFFFSGFVVKGDQIGRQLGYPTANLEYNDEDKIHLGEGVYAVYVQIGEVRRKGMLSIGKRPTINDNIERVEVNIFDWHDDLYGQTIQIQVHTYLRAQIKYDTLESLKIQLAKDKDDALRVLKN